MLSLYAHLIPGVKLKFLKEKKKERKKTLRQARSRIEQLNYSYPILVYCTDFFLLMTQGLIPEPQAG